MPALILLLVAPFVGELLLGSSPWHLLRAYPALLPLHVALYGSGAVLIRELTRRTARGWPSLLLLALAYGLVEEGLGDLSLWNPDYQGLRLLDLASFAGIGWFHWLHVLTMHVVWSMATSIALVEGLFPERARSLIGRPQPRDGDLSHATGGEWACPTRRSRRVGSWTPRSTGQQLLARPTT
jgi:hypothetical protein